MKLKYLSCSRYAAHGIRYPFGRVARKSIHEDGTESEISGREKDGNVRGK